MEDPRIINRKRERQSRDVVSITDVSRSSIRGYTRQVLAHVVSHCLPIRIHVQARFIVRVILAVQVEYRIIVYACLDIHKEALDITCRSLMI